MAPIEPTGVLLVASFAESIINFRGPLIESLLAAGCKVHVAAPGLAIGTPIQVSLVALGVVTHDIHLRRVGTNPLADFALTVSLWRLMRDIRPETMLAYTIKPVIYGSLAAWLAGVPRRFALVTGLGYAFTGGRRSFLTRLIRRLYAFALGKTQKVFFQNPDDEALFRQLGILASYTPSVVVHGSGVDVSAFVAQPARQQPLKFLMIARLLGDKGVREYAEAARLVRQRCPHVRFDLVGWIDENPDAITRSELNNWIDESTIEFLGKLSDVRPAIAEASVYVLPSYREGTPRTVLEAMAMGRPIITTDAPGCRETVIDGENGFLVPVKSVDALVAAMVCFIEQPELLAPMGKRSREIAEDKYDVHKVNAVMLQEMGIVAEQETGRAQQI
ncbi:MAG: glycosyltransferase family 4 protein [Granulicella sp.]